MKFACAYVFARKNLFWHSLCNKEKFVVLCIYGLVYLTSNIFFLEFPDGLIARTMPAFMRRHAYQQFVTKKEFCTMNNATLKNCTPHTINILRAGVVEAIPASGIIPRVSTSTKEVESIDGFAVVETVFGKVENLPDPQPGVFLIVSAMVLAEAKKAGRTDCIAPDTGATAVRENGQVKHVVRFTR